MRESPPLYGLIVDWLETDGSREIVRRTGINPMGAWQGRVPGRDRLVTYHRTCGNPGSHIFFGAKIEQKLRHFVFGERPDAARLRKSSSRFDRIHDRLTGPRGRKFQQNSPTHQHRLDCQCRGSRSGQKVQNFGFGEFRNRSRTLFRGWDRCRYRWCGSVGVGWSFWPLYPCHLWSSGLKKGSEISSTKLAKPSLAPVAEKVCLLAAIHCRVVLEKHPERSDPVSVCKHPTRDDPWIHFSGFQKIAPVIPRFNATILVNDRTRTFLINGIGQQIGEIMNLLGSEVFLVPVVPGTCIRAVSIP